MVFPYGRGTYSFTIDQKSKRVILPLPADLKNTSRYIYRFEDSKTGECLYVGKTAQIFAKRMQNHLAGINNPENAGGKKALYLHIQKNPANVIAVPIPYSSEYRSLSEMEKAFVSKYKPIFNSDKGGGGGSAKVPSNLGTPTLTKAEAKTPPRGYPITRKGIGELAGSTPVNKIYGLRKKRTINSPAKWYVGQTARPIRKRVSEHKSKSKRGKHPLSKALIKNPKAFELFILRGCSRQSLDGWEKAYIKAKGAQAHGYNQNRGGGGGTIATPPASPYKEPVVRIPTN